MVELEETKRSLAQKEDNEANDGEVAKIRRATR